jgi:hypothetical protein
MRIAAVSVDAGDDRARGELRVDPGAMSQDWIAAAAERFGRTDGLISNAPASRA